MANKLHGEQIAAFIWIDMPPNTAVRTYAGPGVLETLKHYRNIAVHGLNVKSWQKQNIQ